MHDVRILFDNSVDKVLDLDYLEATSRFSFMDDVIATGHWEGIEKNDELSAAANTLWYPDYDTPWTEAGCKSFIPSTYETMIHSDRPHYSSQLECCEASILDTGANKYHIQPQPITCLY
jgi:hypothetical protein